MHHSENRSCSSCGTHRVIFVTNPVISHEWGKDQNVVICDTDIPQPSWWQLLNRRRDTFNFATRKPWFSSFLGSSDLYNGNHDKHITPSSGISYQLRHVYITSCGNFPRLNFPHVSYIARDVHSLYLILIIAHVLLMFISRTVRLLAISCCLSHLVCQLTLTNIYFFSLDELFYY
jgi:hypothetical protein